MALGGYINLRTSYDFMGAVDNIDFVPYYIPMATTYANRQRIMMDATTSRLYMKTIVNSSSLGRIVAFVDMDFRGGDEFSYTPRLRSAYVKVGGFTVGRDVTTFCDLLAGPQTVDFRGPNAYNFNFNTMIRFEQPFLRDHWTFALAAEMPRVNATYGENFSRISQRVPDGVVYLQYAWGKGRRNHLRASGVVRDMYLHNNLSGENTTRVGWGTQFSGHIAFNSFLDIFFNGVYGEGISPYIQDLAGAPYDLMADPANPGSIKTMPMGLAGGRPSELRSGRVLGIGRLLERQHRERRQPDDPRPVQEGTVHIRQYVLQHIVELHPRRGVSARLPREFQ